MPSEQELADIASVGRKAAHLMQEDVFVDCIEWVRDDLHKQWAGSKPEDPQARESAYFELAGLRRVIEKLRLLEGRGKTATVELEALKARRRNDGGGESARVV